MQFYISRLTPYLKKIAKYCHACQKINQILVKVERGILLSFPHIGSTPELTLAVDMVGPFYVKRPGMETRGTLKQKFCLLVSANTYNHQLFCTGLDSQNLKDLMIGFQELFVATGKPTLIMTDTGSNFTTLAVRYGKNQLVAQTPAKKVKKT